MIGFAGLGMLIPYPRECDFNSLGSWSYSKEWVWNLGTRRMLHYFREVKCQLCDSSGIWYQQNNSNRITLLILCLWPNGQHGRVLVTKAEFVSCKGFTCVSLSTLIWLSFLLKTNDWRGRRSNLLFTLFGVLGMLQLKLWRAMGESDHPDFVGNWWTIICTFLALSTHCHWMSSPSRK